MRASSITLEDVLASARALGRINAAGADRSALARAAAGLLARRALAEAHRAAHGRVHPRFGDGTLASAAARLTGGGEPADPGCAATIRGAAAICAALAEAVDPPHRGGHAAAS